MDEHIFFSYPKILVISHNCLSLSGSNGRTLRNFLDGYPKDNIAQFYIYNELPDSDICNSYYRVLDKEALNSCFRGRAGGRVNDKKDKTIKIEKTQKKNTVNHTPFVYCIRELFWKIGNWNNNDLDEWIDSFSPEVILFQAGDAAFLYEFAVEIKHRKNIPLIIYNSESYYFKDFNYLQPKKKYSLFYKIWHSYYKIKVKKTINDANYCIYNSAMLRDLYDKEFNTPSAIIMTSSQLVGHFSEKKLKNTNILISYLGNLGVGRDQTLIELSEVLQSIDSHLHIDVYGNASSSIVEKLEKTPGFAFHGFIKYEECMEIMKNSTILIHIENFSDFYLKDSKYAFSTKIADSLACGTCLFVYAPKSVASTQYLMNTKSAAVASSIEEAKIVLQGLISNSTVREAYVRRAYALAEKNHSIKVNQEKFFRIINEVLK